jgi:hypothetical protein
VVDRSFRNANQICVVRPAISLEVRDALAGQPTNLVVPARADKDDLIVRGPGRRDQNDRAPRWPNQARFSEAMDVSLRRHSRATQGNDD